MLEAVLTVINLAIAAVCLAAGTAKAVAAHRSPDTTLRITASVLLHAAVVYLLSAPAVYRAVGSALGLPSLPSLLVSITILLCIGHAHLLTLLWHPRSRKAARLRRSVTPWAAMYLSSITAMVSLFWAADLTGPARPLSYATSYAHIPAAFCLQLVYLAAMVAGIIATVGQCRGPDGVIALPERPDLTRSLRLFAAAVALDLGYAACTLTAVVAAASGHRGLDFLAGLGSVASSVSALVASYGLAKPALAAREAERRDYEALIPLWHLVVDAVDRKLALVPHRVWWFRGLRWALSRCLTEIRDGCRKLSPWMSTAPAQTVRDLANADPEAYADLDVEAAQAAATLMHAAAHFDAAKRRAVAEAAQAGEEPHAPVPPDVQLAVLPGGNIPAAGERDHLVSVAQHLAHPIVEAALQHISSTSAEMSARHR